MSTIGSAYIYLGSATGLATSPDTTLTGSDGSSFGFSVASAGDVNDDGYADVVVGALGVGPIAATGGAYVYLGSATGLAASPATTLTGPDGGGGYFGGSVASAGRANGDRYADVRLARAWDRDAAIGAVRRSSPA